ncbi:neuropeptide B, partial [Orycteropus afer afer]|uniref:Neuropeptide B n=1 Tax=Orycteropus afer afer TaxID=1230840 RepID=A0A8B7BCV4_ORYAF
ALVLLLAPPGRAWYRAAAGPGYYSVGRAAGLLSGLRRSPHARRAEPPAEVGPPGRADVLLELRPSPQSLAVCIRQVVPSPRSCWRHPDSVGTFQCKADVVLSLRATDCRGA